MSRTAGYEQVLAFDTEEDLSLYLQKSNIKIINVDCLRSESLNLIATLHSPPLDEKRASGKDDLNFHHGYRIQIEANYA